MKQFLATDGMKLNDTFKKRTEVVVVIKGSGFIREGDEFNTYSQFNQIYGEAAGVRLNGRAIIEKYLARIGLMLIENGGTKVITKVGDPVGDMFYDFYVANSEPAISRMNNTWQGESREKINQFLRDKPWEKVEGKLRYRDYHLTQRTAGAIFNAMPQTRLFEIKEADFEINLPEKSLWKINRVYRVVGMIDTKRADITCVCGKKVKMRIVRHLENGASLCCRSCSVRTTDFNSFYKSISNEGYTVIKDFEESRPTNLSRIILQCPNSSHQEYSTYQDSWMNVGRRCPACSAFSVGERKVREFLQSKDIQFKEQVRFDDLIGTRGGKLSYDFMIELNGQSILLELDGEQHFKSVEAWGGEAALQRNIEHDRLKTVFAVQNNLRIVRIQNVGSNHDFILNSLDELLSGSTANHYGNLYQKES